ncbi:hypothetical protein [Rhabdothermincola sediminis]|uniref:hypothetical protein n=1 Tax=Rhabdothermincola sediminis TaxID=2751370 RepID=UPI001AA0863A|nr:hypothetical protein [Rhabdothermincola sediminis]
MSTASPGSPSTPLGTLMGRAIVVVIVLGSALLWIYALTRSPGKPPGSLDDPSFGAAAEPICASAQARLVDLPPAFEAPEPAARAATISSATEALQAMVDGLRSIAPSRGTRDGDMVAEWLDDWQTYLGDRRAHAARLAEEGDVRFYVTEKEGRQITAPIDRFAQVNHMPSCATPGDLG